MRDKNRATLLNPIPKEKDDMKIPFVLTYHPAMYKVYDILRKNQNLLLVDSEHETVFKDKILVSFRRAKSLKDKLVRAKLPSVDAELMEKGIFRCNGRSCQICPLMGEGDTFPNFDSTRSFKNFSGRYDCNSDHVVYLLQCESHATRNMWGVLRLNFGKGLMFTSPILGHTHANTTKILLIKGSLSHRLLFSVISLKTDTMGLFGWVSKL